MDQAKQRRLWQSTCVLAISTAALLVACRSKDSDSGKVRGSGVAKTEARTVDAFDGILLVGGASLNVTIGASGPLEITADDNILPHLETSVTDGRLTIKPDTPIKPDVTIVIKVTTDALKDLAVRGAGNVKVYAVDNETLSIKIEGAANVYAEGKTDGLDVLAEGAGNLDLAKLMAQKAVVILRGAGSADVYAAEKLDATIEGMGRIEYYGDAEVTENIKGLGVITKGG